MHTGNYTCLEIFARKTAEGGHIRLIGENQKITEKEAGNGYYAWLKFSLSRHAEYEIVCEGCEASLCYLSGNEDILETGVCFLERDEAGAFVQANPALWYDGPTREAYHFSPWKNWNNDPNGLCYFHGYYHMFYQYNPNGQEWSNMYWGHALSEDLVHWRHLPVVLAPQQDILENQDTLKGGAFSGCALALEDEVVFYLTRHRGPLLDGADSIEQQWMMKSSDMIHFTEETCVIGHPPAHASFDFRDPKVQRIGESWYMAVGSALEGRGAILLYRSQDMEHWSYVHPLLVEENARIRCFECPDFMELDGKFVVLGAFMEHSDDCGRYQMSRYYTGNFQDERFQAEHEGWFDFGSNCYAMQSFEHGGRRICIGWVSDFYGEHVAYENGAYGSMTLPRELHVKAGKLYMRPVEELRRLVGDVLYKGSRENLRLEHIEGNAYRADIAFGRNTCFQIVLGKEGEKELSLVNDRDGFRIVTKGVRSEGIRFQADVEEVKELEIYVDRRMAEVYVNGGEAAGTKLFYSSSKEGSFALSAEEPEMIERAKVCLMKSIWN